LIRRPHDSPAPAGAGWAASRCPPVVLRFTFPPVARRSEQHGSTGGYSPAFRRGEDHSLTLGPRWGSKYPPRAAYPNDRSSSRWIPQRIAHEQTRVRRRIHLQSNTNISNYILGLLRLSGPAIQLRNLRHCQSRRAPAHRYRPSHHNRRAHPLGRGVPAALNLTRLPRADSSRHVSHVESIHQHAVRGRRQSPTTLTPKINPKPQLSLTKHHFSKIFKNHTIILETS